MTNITVNEPETPRVPAPEPGNWYRYEDGTLYVLAKTSLGRYALINVHEGDRWADPQPTTTAAFDGRQDEFTYIPNVAITT